MTLPRTCFEGSLNVFPYTPANVTDARSTTRALAGKLTAARRWHADDVDAVTALERDVATAKIHAAIVEALSKYPAPTAEQVDALVAAMGGDRRG